MPGSPPSAAPPAGGAPIEQPPAQIIPTPSATGPRPATPPVSPIAMLTTPVPAMLPSPMSPVERLQLRWSMTRRLLDAIREAVPKVGEMIDRERESSGPHRGLLTRETRGEIADADLAAYYRYANLLMFETPRLPAEIPDGGCAFLGAKDDVIKFGRAHLWLDESAIPDEAGFALDANVPSMTRVARYFWTGNVYWMLELGCGPYAFGSGDDQAADGQDEDHIVMAYNLRDPARFVSVDGIEYECTESPEPGVSWEVIPVEGSAVQGLAADVWDQTTVYCIDYLEEGEDRATYLHLFREAVPYYMDTVVMRDRDEDVSAVVIADKVVRFVSGELPAAGEPLPDETHARYKLLEHAELEDVPSEEDVPTSSSSSSFTEQAELAPQATRPILAEVAAAPPAFMANEHELVIEDAPRPWMLPVRQRIARVRFVDNGPARFRVLRLCPPDDRILTASAERKAVVLHASPGNARRAITALPYSVVGAPIVTAVSLDDDGVDMVDTGKEIRAMNTRLGTLRKASNRMSHISGTPELCAMLRTFLSAAYGAVEPLADFRGIRVFPRIADALHYTCAHQHPIVTNGQDNPRVVQRSRFVFGGIRPKYFSVNHVSAVRTSVKWKQIAAVDVVVPMGTFAVYAMPHSEGKTAHPDTVWTHEAFDGVLAADDRSMSITACTSVSYPKLDRIVIKRARAAVILRIDGDGPPGIVRWVTPDKRVVSMEAVHSDLVARLRCDWLPMGTDDYVIRCGTALRSRNWDIAVPPDTRLVASFIDDGFVIAGYELAGSRPWGVNDERRTHAFCFVGRDGAVVHRVEMQTTSPNQRDRLVAGASTKDDPLFQSGQYEEIRAAVALAAKLWGAAGGDAMLRRVAEGAVASAARLCALWVDDPKLEHERPVDDALIGELSARFGSPSTVAPPVAHYAPADVDNGLELQIGDIERRFRQTGPGAAGPASVSALRTGFGDRIAERTILFVDAKPSGTPWWIALVMTLFSLEIDPVAGPDKPTRMVVFPVALPTYRFAIAESVRGAAREQWRLLAEALRKVHAVELDITDDALVVLEQHIRALLRAEIEHVDSTASAINAWLKARAPGDGILGRRVLCDATDASFEQVAAIHGAVPRNSFVMLARTSTCGRLGLCAPRPVGPDSSDPVVLL